MKISTKNIKREAIVLMVFFVLAAIACRKKETSGYDIGEAYFPLKKGSYIVYAVDSTWYDDFSLDTIQKIYQLKERCDTLFETAEGKTAMRIERFRRLQAGDEWGAPRIYWAYTENGYAIKAEENLLYVKLQFPVKKGTTWNINRFNFLSQEDFRIEKADVDTSINGILFDSSAFAISRASYESKIDKYRHMEVYARNIGLIYREYIKVDSVYRDKVGSDTNNLPVMDKIKKGYVYRQAVLEWGQE